MMGPDEGYHKRQGKRESPGKEAGMEDTKRTEAMKTVAEAINKAEGQQKRDIEMALLGFATALEAVAGGENKEEA